MIASLRITLLSAAAILLAGVPQLGFAAPRPMPAVPPASGDSVRIVAIVNGSVITNDDVAARARLFAVSSGLPIQPEVLDRLRPQIARQLVDERLRMQDVERQHIVVSDKQVAEAIKEIESRNGMQPGALRAKLSADGVSFGTLIDQVRTEIGWTLVLRRQLGERLRVSSADVSERMRALAQETGQPEYHVAEIFLALDNPTKEADTRRFAEIVIHQLRAGAPFPVVAAQFSQAQSALEGGDMGWVQANQLDPEVAAIAQQMPVGAVSEPIRVPGGLVVVHMIAKREIGRDFATVLSLRQVFLPFSTPLNPTAPTAQQEAALNRAKAITARVRSCSEMEQVAQEEHSPRPADPGEVRLDNVNPPAFRALLASLPIGKASKPLVAPDGIAVMSVCSRDEKNLDQLSAKQIEEQLLQTRVELLSRQMEEDLRRRASIDMRLGPVSAQT